VPISVRSVANTDNTGREFHLPRFVLKRNGGRFLRIGKGKFFVNFVNLVTSESEGRTRCNKVQLPLNASMVSMAHGQHTRRQQHIAHQVKL